MKIAVVGVSNNLGRQLLNSLAGEYFAVENVVGLDLKNEIGQEISFGDEDILVVQDLNKYDFLDCQIVISTFRNYAVAEKYIEKAVENDCIIIDCSGHFNNDTEIPMIIPEINASELSKVKEKRIIANPTDTVIQLALALNPLNQVAKIKRIVLSTYQAVSSLGKEAMDELFNNTKKIYENEFLPAEHFSKQIPFNVIPQVGLPAENGYYDGEKSLINEIHRLFGKNIGVSATCVRVPVFTGNSESVNIEFESHICEHEIEEIYENDENVMMFDRYEENIFATPLESALEKVIFVSRIRKDFSVENGINMWIVADNMVAGSTLNIVKIVELLIKNKEEYF